ncbi:hypothetical protein Goari_011594 [Gossypium aridum]|uniref:Uncharacterized protein n=1 Tax=Gossypium aridum TaxID=34290 RepID=A0A7J8WXU3_GOSAI|nr:hypothetical protein [Gossypium aridum]
MASRLLALTLGMLRGWSGSFACIDFCMFPVRGIQCPTCWILKASTVRVALSRGGFSIWLYWLWRGIVALRVSLWMLSFPLG